MHLSHRRLTDKADIRLERGNKLRREKKSLEKSRYFIKGGRSISQHNSFFVRRWRHIVAGDGRRASFFIRSTVGPRRPGAGRPVSLPTLRPRRVATASVAKTLEEDEGQPDEDDGDADDDADGNEAEVARRPVRRPRRTRTELGPRILQAVAPPPFGLPIRKVDETFVAALKFQIWLDDEKT